MDGVIRRCAARDCCGYLVRWQRFCPLHHDLARRPDQPDRLPSRRELYATAVREAAS